MTIMTRKIRAGIAGTGQVATKRHIPAYQRDGRVIIQALYNPVDPMGAKEVARRFGVKHTLTDLQAFLQQPFEIVSICTPPFAHASLIDAALQAGKHVLSEKPMIMRAEEGKALEALAREKGLLLCPVHNFIYSRAVTRAKKFLENGEIGEPTGAMGVQWSSWNRRLPKWFPDLPGRLFFDESPHLIYLLRHFLGDLKLVNAWCKTEYSDNNFGMDRFEISFEGEKGWGSMSMWFGAPMSEWLIVVGCTRGTLVIDLFRDILLKFPPEYIRNYKFIAEIPMRVVIQIVEEMTKKIVKRIVYGRHLYGNEELIRQFVDAVILGEKPPTLAREGWEVVSVIEDILQFCNMEKSR